MKNFFKKFKKDDKNINSSNSTDNSYNSNVDLVNLFNENIYSKPFSSKISYLMSINTSTYKEYNEISTQLEKICKDEKSKQTNKNTLLIELFQKIQSVTFDNYESFLSSCSVIKCELELSKLLIYSECKDDLKQLFENYILIEIKFNELFSKSKNMLIEKNKILGEISGFKNKMNSLKKKYNQTGKWDLTRQQLLNFRNELSIKRENFLNEEIVLNQSIMTFLNDYSALNSDFMKNKNEINLIINNFSQTNNTYNISKLENIISIYKNYINNKFK